MNVIDSMWTEKYRPKNISEMVGDFKGKIRKYMENPATMQHLLLHSIVPGTGKCLGKNTPILMFDGTIKKVQDIVDNDKLMGPDSKSRLVKGVTKGRDKLYLVKQKNGDDYVVNKDHILATIISHTNEKRLITAEDFFNKQGNYRSDLKGYKVGVDFKEQKIYLDPYLLGLWLGDGTAANQRIHNPDKEIISYLKQYADSIGYKLNNHNGKKSTGRCEQWSINSGKKGYNNIFLDLLRSYNLLDNKHIPDNYLYNSVDVRLNLLAGFLDTDGYKDRQGYEIIQKNVVLANQIVYLARSLGFRTTIKDKISSIKSTGFSGKYKRIHINGNVWNIPCKVKRKIIKEHKRQKDALRCGIEIKSEGNGNYYGFTVDKDGLFLLGDFTVTHNTSLAKAIIAELDADKLVLNSSDDRKIETVREKVNGFVRTKSSKQGMRRIVFMDEADGLTSAAQDALRNLMETYSENALFILTCNTLSKISDAIQSRCVNIQFANPKKEEISTYLKMICENESMKYTDAGLLRIIEINYPSIRNCVQVLQSLHTEGKDATEDTAKSSDDESQMIWDKVTTDKDWKFVKEYLFGNSVDIKLLNKFFWYKAVEESYIKMIQITAVNEDKFTRGGEELVIFVTSLIEMVK